MHAHKPYALSPEPNPHKVPKPSLLSRLTGLHKIPVLGLSSTSVCGDANAAIVFRTWGLLKQQPNLQKQFYGPNFTYQEFMKAKNFLLGMTAHYSLLIGGILLMFCSPVRSLLRKFVFQPGEGPSREEADQSYIEFRGVATPDSEVKKDHKAWGKACFKGSMYYREFLTQCSFCLPRD